VHKAPEMGGNDAGRSRAKTVSICSADSQSPSASSAAVTSSFWLSPPVSACGAASIVASCLRFHGVVHILMHVCVCVQVSLRFHGVVGRLTFFVLVCLCMVDMYTCIGICRCGCLCVYCVCSRRTYTASVRLFSLPVSICMRFSRF